MATGSYVFCTFWIWSCVFVAIETSVIEDTIVTSRCRANCLDKFVVKRYDGQNADKQCYDNRQCLECWELCHLLVIEPLEHNWNCNPRRRDFTCLEGCKLGCDFLYNLQDKDGAAKESYTMTGEVTVSNDTHLYITGHVVLAHEAYPRHVVYALLYSVPSAWKFFSASTNPRFSMTAEHDKMPHLRFLIFAVTAEELIGWTDPTIPKPAYEATTSSLNYYDYYDYDYDYDHDYTEYVTGAPSINYLHYEDIVPADKTTEALPPSTAVTTTTSPATDSASLPSSSGTTRGRYVATEDMNEYITHKHRHAHSGGTAKPKSEDSDDAEVPVYIQQPSRPLIPNDLLLVILALCGLLVIVIFALAVFMLCSNMRLRKELLRLRQQPRDITLAPSSGDASSPGKNEIISHRSSTLKKGVDMKRMTSLPVNHRVITVDARTMRALRLPLLHSTPSPNVRTLPAYVETDVSDDIPSIVVHSSDDVNGVTEYDVTGESHALHDMYGCIRV